MSLLIEKRPWKTVIILTVSSLIFLACSDTPPSATEVTKSDAERIEEFANSLATINDETGAEGSDAVMTAASVSAPMIVYKSASCGCCAKWVDAMETAGFVLEVRNLAYASLQKIKKLQGIEDKYASCHTAIVGPYFIEGHVAPETVRQFLNIKNEKIRGITVPGMVIGTVGMEVGDRKDPYTVYAITKDFNAITYKTFP